MRPPSRLGAHRVPMKFMCPISKKFMKEPVIVPSTQETCDYKSLVSLRMNSNNNNLRPSADEDELLMPDHKLRAQNKAWLHKYKRRHPFAYISTPLALERAVTSLITREEDDILQDSDFLNNLRQLSSTISGKISMINSALGFSSVAKLIAGCPVYSEHQIQWVQICVGIIAKADNIDKKNPNLLIDYLLPALAVIDSVCVHIRDRELRLRILRRDKFQMGFVNFIDSFMEIENSCEKIMKHGDNVIRTLSSYAMYIFNKNFNKDSFDKMFSAIMRLWRREDGLRKPKLSQAVASFVWPMPWHISMTQYLDFLKTLSSLLHRQDLDNFMEGSLELMTRARLVSPVFDVLNYVTLPEEEKRIEMDGWVSRTAGQRTDREQENVVIMRCFEILSNLSSITIGRLEIVRVIAQSGYTSLDDFYGAILLTANREHADTHLVPALTVLVNLLVNARYTKLFDQRVESHNYQDFLLIDFEHGFNERVRALAREFFATVSTIRSQELPLRGQQY